MAIKLAPCLTGQPDTKMRLVLSAFLCALVAACASPSGTIVAIYPDLPKVVFLGEVQDAPCSRISLLMGQKAENGYGPVRKLVVKLFSTGPDRPMVFPMDPSEYHIVGADCSSTTEWLKIGDVGVTNRLVSPIYPYSYASFQVRDEKMLDLGSLLFVFSGDRVSKVMVMPMPEQTHAALKRTFPEAYSQMVSRPMIVSETNLSGPKSEIVKQGVSNSYHVVRIR